MYIYTYIYIYIYTCIYIHIYIYIHWYGYTLSQTDLCMSISIYGRAQRTCGRSCPHAQTHTYTRIYTHTNWNTHTHTLTYEGILLFSSVSLTLWLRVEFLIENWSWVSYGFFDFFVVMKPENPYSTSRPGTGVKPNAILVFPAIFFPHQSKNWPNICTTQRAVVQILFLKEKLGSWTDTPPTNQPPRHVCVCCFVLLNRYWGIVMYGPGASSWASQGRHTHDRRSLTSQPYPVPP